MAQVYINGGSGLRSGNFPTTQLAVTMANNCLTEHPAKTLSRQQLAKTASN